MSRWTSGGPGRAAALPALVLTVRCAALSETFPPPREDDGFAVSGRATEISDQATWNTVRDQVIADFGQLWPDYESLTLFELSVASCLLTLTQPDGAFPKGPTIWKA
ncbi:MAG TPA: hypothetical protein VMI73_01570 [Trebonia sp.]|nr:hypothetical protein [Trebonia sp.]